MAALATWLCNTSPQLDELTAAQLEALYAELEIIEERVGALLEARELRRLREGLDAAKRTVYARLTVPVQRLVDGDR